MKAHYQKGGLGDVKVKKFLNSAALLQDIHHVRQGVIPVGDILPWGQKDLRGMVCTCLLYTSQLSST